MAGWKTFSLGASGVANGVDCFFLQEIALGYGKIMEYKTRIFHHYTIPVTTLFVVGASLEICEISW